MKPIIGIECRLLRIWMNGDYSYEVEVIRKSYETFYIEFPPETNVRILANGKTAHVTPAHIVYENCKVDIYPDSQYIKIY